MRVVVTGAAGFIGRATVRRLAGLGHTVVALVRDPARAAEILPNGTELVQSDLSGRDVLVTAMAGADGVIHLAGSYRVGIRADERPAMEDERRCDRAGARRGDPGRRAAGRVRLDRRHLRRHAGADRR